MTTTAQTVLDYRAAQAARFAGSLQAFVDQLEEIGESECGCLSFAQAALFHHATALLRDLYRDLLEQEAHHDQAV